MQPDTRRDRVPDTRDLVPDVRRARSVRAVWQALAALLLAGLLPAGHPQVSSIVPRGAQRGTEVTLTITGQRLQSIEGLVLFRPGIEVLGCKGERANLATVRIRIAADCPLGAHEVLVRTALGLSNLKLFMVGTLPELTEKEPNDDKERAQRIPLGVTVEGVITAEDVDVFAVPVEKGQRMSIEVEGLRLGDLEFDPHLTVHDDQGKRLAMVDDTIFALMDPLACLTCERSGTWFLTVRESARGGSNNSHYRLHVGTFPRPTVAFPAGGTPGQPLDTHLLGPGGEFEAQLDVPARPGLHKVFVTTADGTTPTPIDIVATDKPNLFEAGLAPKPAPGCGIGAWRLIGPFTNPRDKAGRSTGHAVAYPPETGAGVETGREIPGRDGAVKWQPHAGLRDNATHDLRRLVAKSDDSVVYLARTLDAATPRRVLCLIGADDTFKLWHDGKLVEQDTKASTQPAQLHRVILELRAGANQLLLKVTNRNGPLAFHCRILDPLRLTDHGHLAVPAALNGVIRAAGEEDRFVFLARSGEGIDFQVVGRRLRSPLDPVVGCYCTHDRFYAGNDDAGGPGVLDSLLRFRAPFTGEFVFTIRDMLMSGGPRYVYRVEVSRPGTAPLALRALLPGFNDEWTVDVPAGGRNAILIDARNLDASAGVQLDFRGLPEGMAARAPQFAPGSNSVPVVFAAREGLAHQAALLHVDATASRKQLDLSTARFLQSVEIVQARNQQNYLNTPIDRLPVAVVAATPFTLEVAPPAVPIVRNSPLEMSFKLVRAAGYTQPVRVRMLYNPPGISSGQVTVPAGKDSGSITLYADGNARTGSHPIVLVASAPVDGAPVSTSSDLLDLEVTTPWLDAKVGDVRTETGTSVSLSVELKRAREFGGAVAAEWIGLPRGVTCAPLQIAADTTKAGVDVTVAANAPPGRHRNFRLRLRIKTDHGEVVEDFRMGEIRIDPPPTSKRTGT